MVLTFHTIKIFAMLLCQHLKPFVNVFLYLWFAYEAHVRFLTWTASDGTLTCILRILIYEYSSAFNIMRPALLGSKRKVVQVCGGIDHQRASVCLHHSLQILYDPNKQRGSSRDSSFTIFVCPLYHRHQRQQFSMRSSEVLCDCGMFHWRKRSTVFWRVFDGWWEKNHLQLIVWKKNVLEVDFRQGGSCW